MLTAKTFSAALIRRHSPATQTMSAPSIETRFRLFLLVLAGAMCLGTIVELWLAGHTQQPLQIMPFGLCGLGLIAILAALLRPNLVSLWALRLVMGMAAGGSLIGMAAHINSNLEIVREVNPALAGVAALWQAVRGGAPLLAPGILALAAIIAMAATYYHPALIQRAD